MKAHYHTVGGKLVACYHQCKNILSGPGFWFGVTFSFPVEHWLWTRVYPFKLITEWMGL